jgi:hypothetical protein
MALADEISQLILDELRNEPAARAFIEGGESTLAAYGDAENVLAIVSRVLRAHRIAIDRLATEIDSLRS